MLLWDAEADRLAELRRQAFRNLFQSLFNLPEGGLKPHPPGKPKSRQHPVLAAHIKLCRSMSKRKRVETAQTQQDMRSSFVECPVCLKSVPHLVINNHLDSDCQGNAPVSDVAHSASPPGKPNPGLQACSRNSARPSSKSASSVKTAKLSWTSKAPDTCTKAVAHFKQRGQAPADKSLSTEELEGLAPLSVDPQVLPPALADMLLRDLSQAGPDWVRGTWWMFGKEHAAPRTSAYFQISQADVSAMSSTIVVIVGLGNEVVLH